MSTPVQLTQLLDEIERLEAARRGVSNLIDDKELSSQETQDICQLLGLLNEWQETNIARLRASIVKACHQ